MNTSAQQQYERLSGKDRADVLMKLAEFRLTRQHRRRDYEWRVSFGLWVALVSALVTVKQRPNEIILDAVLILTVIVHWLLWIMPLARRNRLDMKMAFFFSERAAKMVANKRYLIEPTPERKPS